MHLIKQFLRLIQEEPMPKVIQEEPMPAANFPQSHAKLSEIERAQAF